MAYHGSSAELLANGYDIGQFLSDLSLSSTVDTAETTTYGPMGTAPTQKSYIPGLGDASLDGGGVWSADTTGLTQDKVDDILQAALRTAGGAKTDLTYLPIGDGFGNSCVGLEGVEAKYDIESPVNDIVKATMTVESCVGREALQVAHVLQSEVASGQSNSLDAGAAYLTGAPTPQSLYKGGVLYAHCTAVTGAGTLALKLQHSVDGTTWVDLVTAPNITGKNQALRAIATGAAGSVNRYLCVQWTITGFTAVTFHVAVGRVKV